MKTSKLKILLLLHLMLMIYSMSGICSKKAAGEVFLSPAFCGYYVVIILLLGFYAIGWQQVIKQLSLTVAFANKAVTVIWGTIWGLLFFHETITIGKIIGVVFVVFGIILYAFADQEAENE